jgi:hypothetical protein
VVLTTGSNEMRIDERQTAALIGVIIIVVLIVWGVGAHLNKVALSDDSCAMSKAKGYTLEQCGSK